MREIAERSGYTYRTVVAWRMNGLLPPPEAVVGGSPRWDWVYLRAWLVEHKKIDESGRPLQLPPPRRPAWEVEQRIRRAQRATRHGGRTRR